MLWLTASLICSTYDGVAIAYATLSHLARIGCSTLFVTHYPTVAEELAKEYPNTISNWHMAFDEVKMPGQLINWWMHCRKLTH